ncbi:response regulator [Ahrensia marina]|uniref:response regulator n=1 Tax=Ahrensia marina TaxID=1514904 RepID=UPI0035CEB245
MQDIASATPSPLARVLVVDDDELDRFVIRRSFNALESPIELIEIADSRQAVNAITTHEPNVTLLDIQMPNMSGFDVLDALGKLEADQDKVRHVVMLSSSSQQEDRRRALALGATDYRAKPSTLSDYVKLVEDIRAAYLQPS